MAELDSSWLVPGSDVITGIGLPLLTAFLKFFLLLISMSACT